MKEWVAGLLLLVPVMLPAQGVVPQENDFAYAVPLEVDGDGALYVFDLPAGVYRYSTRKDLGDMRIFNGYGRLVPHLLRPGVSRDAMLQPPLGLRFYPLHRSAEGRAQIHIATDREGRIHDLWQRGQLQPEATPGRYLIDASELDKPIESLLLEWDETAESFLVPVSLAYSNDLASWRQLPDTATLAALRYEGYRLVQREIHLPPVEANYFRITWPLGEKGIRLRSVRAKPVHGAGSVTRHWLRLSPRGDATRQGVYEFRADGHYPVDRIRIDLPQPDTVVRVRLLSRAEGEGQPWQLRHQGLIYHLQRDGYRLRHNTVQLSGVNDPNWRLEIGMEGGGSLEGEPQLALGWVPHRLYFVTRGEMPFRLAFGAAGIDAPRSRPAQLQEALEQALQGNGFIKTASSGPRYELGGEQRLQSEPQQGSRLHWALWSVLIFGVLLLFLATRRRHRQMGAADRFE